MTLLGLDFDNTLVCYDNLFKQLAVERGLIHESMQADKVKIRDYLNQMQKKREFTILQGEVYGKRILEAEPSDGVLSALKAIREKGIEMILISHKTKYPIDGYQYNLHDAAIKWLDKHRFFCQDFLGWNYDQLYFEQTRKGKIERIKQLGCTHFVDDLPEVINEIEGKVIKILYDPKRKYSLEKSASYIMNKWEDLNIE